MIFMSSETLVAKPYALFFQALGNPSRMQILQLLKEKGSKNVSQICEELGLEQTHVSHSLRCLTFCGLVNARREGKSKIYSINDQTILPLLSIVDYHLKKYASDLFSCDVLER
jgi:ArsR family transcriptional regulator